MIKTFNKFVNRLTKLEEVILVLGFSLIVFLVFLQIIMRSVFKTGFYWSEEVTRFIFVFITWIGASVAAKEKRHINVSIIYDIFPSISKYLKGIGISLSIVMSMFLAIDGLKLVIELAEKNQVSPALQIPMHFIYIMIPLAGSLLSLKYFMHLIEYLSNWKERNQ